MSLPKVEPIETAIFQPMRDMANCNTKANAIKAEFPEAMAFLFQPHRYKGIRGGRGKGASWGVARALLILGAMRPLRIACCRETQKSIADSVHTLLSDQIAALGLDRRYTVQQATIVGTNGTEFIFAGLKANITNIKSLEGADILWIEEASSVSKLSWSTVIPTVRKDYITRGLPKDPDHKCEFVGCCSEIWATWNDNLETDETYRLLVVNPPPGAAVKKLTFRDNPWFPDVLRVEMEHLKATDEAAYQHVWEGECRSAVEGAIYAEELKKADAEKRITSVPWDRSKPVDTFWDLGFGDSTAIWFAQPVGAYYHLIDYEEGAGKTISDYIVILQQRGYVYGTDFLPHDGVDNVIHTKLSGDRSRSPDQMMRASGRKVRIVPKRLVTTQINAARTIFPQCRFDADKCAKGLHALRQFQWGEPSQGGVERTKPLHDWASHSASAFQGFAMQMKHPEPEPRTQQMPPRPTGVHGWMA